jgi:hypothetical protein
MLDLAAIERVVKARARMLGTSERLLAVLPTFGRSQDSARPHIEVDGAGYHFVVVERGQELERFTTRDLDALLFRIFNSVTFELAADYESAHRQPNKDCRRLMFSHQEELLGKLSPEWAAREADSHAAILRDNPFVDD